MIRVLVTGISGRMGSRIAELLRHSPGLKLNGGTEAPGSFAVETLLPEGHEVVDDLSKCIEHGDVIIDFTSPEATLKHAKIASEHQKSLVVGTTGFNEKQKNELKELLYTIPAVWAPNMSIGVNVLFKIAAQTAKLLGDDYDIEIVEAHHRHKKDAPSGTALGLAESIASAINRDLKKVACYERHGQIGARPAKEIGIQTLRGGDIVGDHTAIFAGEGERLELTHRANNRDNFARGAILAAKWVAKQAAGIYTMQDVLGLNS
ncbi:MAG: 4-hydroxy-tetrahydrodipicolinate reductase [Deltaproteobacteria bacterium]|nr:4-hydroxy-tetrahydrodipicolinate reductase [Deltaproteobacteria bacterium]